MLVKARPFVCAAFLLWASTPLTAQSSLERVETQAEFEAISIPDSDPQIDRVTKFLAPIDPADPSLLGLVFQNVSVFPFHVDYLRSLPQFAGLSDTEYRSLVETRATRKYYAGLLSLLLPPGQEPVFGFDVITANAEDFPDELLTQAEVKGIYEQLKSSFLLTPLAYAPQTREAIEAAAEWEPDPDLPVFLGTSDTPYIPYTQAVGFGFVRVWDADEFESAASRGLITFRDVLILERAPRDIEGVFAAVITDEKQGELSHVAIRTARRGTPNAFVRGATGIFQEFEDQLIRIEVGPADFEFRPAELPEAEEFWDANRPSLSVLPTIDADYAGLDALSEMDLSSEVNPVSRFGGKATNLARLRLYVDEPYKEEGFAIPARYYLQFVRENTMPSAIDPGRMVTYEEHLNELFTLPQFQNDAEFRFDALDDVRDHMRDFGRVDPQLVQRLVERIGEVFPSTTTMVRFRSSSNVEDDLEFNGAGLYNSTSVCAADQVDGNDSGPSLCDPLRDDERTIERGLKRVWRSLWNFRAYEEREFFQVPQDLSAMAILVSRAFLDERANAVAFTGNPSRPFDPRYLVVAQAGDEASVVSPEPGVISETSLLELSSEGEVVRIVRGQASSLVPEGEFVMSDEKLRELGAILWDLDQNFPLELGEHSRDEVLLDTEVKVEADGSLAIKQIRPFLLTISGPRPPTFVLDVPDGTETCGVWREGRSALKAHQLESRIQLRSGRFDLPAALENFAIDLVESVEVGPDRVPGVPVGEGVMNVQVRAGAQPGVVVYTFAFEQRFDVGGQELVVELARTLEAKDGVPAEPEWQLDEETIMLRLELEGFLAREGDSDTIRYRSCTHELLPINRIFVDLDGGHSLEIEERYELVNLGNSPADFVRAEVNLGGETRVVEDYTQLVYAAQRHNERVVAWIVLDPPVTVGADTVGAIELELEDFKNASPLYPPAARFLAPDFTVLRSVEIVRYCRQEPGKPCASDFRRGDANTDGRVNLSDAVAVLNWLFRSAPELACPDAGDFDDRDDIEPADAILILNFLFQSVDLSTPPGPFDCGPDPTPDGLATCSYPEC